MNPYIIGLRKVFISFAGSFILVYGYFLYKDLPLTKDLIEFMAIVPIILLIIVWIYIFIKIRILKGGNNGHKNKEQYE
jgi:hypothetical protein